MPKSIKVDLNPKIVFFTVLGLMLLYFAVQIKDIIMMLFIAFILNAGLKPLVIKLEKRGLPRWLSIVLIYLLLLAFLVVIVLNLAVQLVNQFQAIRGVIDNADAEIVNFLKDNFPQVEELLKDLDLLDETSKPSESLSKVTSVTTQDIVNFVLGAINLVSVRGVSLIGDVTGGLIAVFTVIIISIYMLTDKQDIYTGIIELFPQKYHSFTIRVIKEIEVSLGKWFTGQLALMLIIGFCSYILVIIPSFFDSSYDLDKYALLIAIIAGLLEGLPSLGPLITFVVTVILAIVTGSPLGAIIFIIITFLALQQIEAVFFVPQIMKNAVNINPVLSILGVVAGLNLAGPIGALIAIPLIASVQIIILEVGDAIRKRNIREEEINQA